MSKNKIVIGLAWLLALLLTAFLIRNISFMAILESIAKLSLAQCLLWLTVNLIIIGIFVQRWSCLAKGIRQNIGFLNLFMLRQAGQSISFITPGPQFGGEPLQVYLLWKKFFIAPAKAVLLVATDRFFELWINFAVLLLGVFFLLFSESELLNLFTIAWILASLIFLLSILAWVFIKQGDKIERMVDSLAEKWLHSSRLAKMTVHWEVFNNSLRLLLSDTKTLISALCFSISGWLLTFVELYLVLSFFDITLSINNFIFLMVVMRLAFLLPLPGGIGTLEAAVIWSFSSMDLSISVAAAVLALIRFRDILVLAAGLYCLRVLQTKTVPVAYFQH
tara:strand:- start:203 stop:1204 length:1002 start_codon:yes stop_codon:yes gene_type:complete